MTRKEAREAVFALIFECEFRGEETPEEICDSSVENREIEENDYIRSAFFTVCEKREEIDALIGEHAQGWKTQRLTNVSRSILRLAAYEMLFVEDIPMNVSISQAVELSVKYGEDKAKQFVNGVLSGLFKDIQSKGIEVDLEEAQSEINAKAEADEAEAVEAEAVEAEAVESETEEAEAEEISAESENV